MSANWPADIDPNSGMRLPFPTRDALDEIGQKAYDRAATPGASIAGLQGPGGISLSDSKKLMGSRLTGALIAVVGDDNDDFIFIGRASEFTANHNGILFLSVNEGNLKDNSGSFLARVKVMSGK